MTDKTNILLCIFLAILLLIIFYMPSPSQPRLPTSVKDDSGAGQEITRLHDTVKKFTRSLGDMEKRLKTLEDNVNHIQKKQESMRVNLPKNSNMPGKRPVNLGELQKETSHQGFAGYRWVCRNSGSSSTCSLFYVFTSNLFVAYGGRLLLMVKQKRSIKTTIW